MTWMIDPAHSAVEFKVRHMMISWVRGEFEKFDGDVVFDPARPEDTRVEIKLDASSINTGVADRDNHLRSADFFDAANHPYLTFVSRGVTVLDDTHATLTGDLTIRGASREVSLDVELVGQARSPWGQEVAGFSAWTRINRKDWGLGWNVALETGGFLVGDDIAINIELELIKQEQTVPEYMEQGEAAAAD